MHKRAYRDHNQGYNEKEMWSGTRRTRNKERNLLTGSNNSSATSTSFGASTTQRQDKAQPAQSQLAAVAVKVRRKSAGSLELAQLAFIRRIADAEDRLEPAGAGGDGTAVDPDVEAGAAAVGAVATLADAAEGEGRDVQRRVIARDAAGAGAR